MRDKNEIVDRRRVGEDRRAGLIANDDRHDKNYNIKQRQGDACDNHHFENIF